MVVSAGEGERVRLVYLTVAADETVLLSLPVHTVLGGTGRSARSGGALVGSDHWKGPAHFLPCTIPHCAGKKCALKWT